MESNLNMIMEKLGVPMVAAPADPTKGKITVVRRCRTRVGSKNQTEEVNSEDDDK